MKLTIEQLASKVNEQLSNLSSQDKRFSSNVSVRRIRDYVSKGVLDKPFKDGKNIYFTELHYQKLIALREIQSEGISEENLKKFISLDLQGNELQKNAFSAINEIIESNITSDNIGGVQAYTNNIKSLSGSIGSKKSGYIESLIDNSALSKSNNTKNYITKPVFKTWSEIPLLNSNKVFLRTEGNIHFSEEEKKEILSNIQQILGIK